MQLSIWLNLLILAYDRHTTLPWKGHQYISSVVRKIIANDSQYIQVQSCINLYKYITYLTLHYIYIYNSMHQKYNPNIHFKSQTYNHISLR